MLSRHQAHLHRLQWAPGAVSHSDEAESVPERANGQSTHAHIHTTARTHKRCVRVHTETRLASVLAHVHAHARRTNTPDNIHSLSCSQLRENVPSFRAQICALSVSCARQAPAVTRRDRARSPTCLQLWSTIPLLPFPAIINTIFCLLPLLLMSRKPTSLSSQWAGLQNADFRATDCTRGEPLRISGPRRRGPLIGQRFVVPHYSQPTPNQWPKNLRSQDLPT